MAPSVEKNPPVPPDAEEVIVASLPPLQVTITNCGIPKVITAGSVTVKVFVILHPLASEAVCVYVPAVRPVAVELFKVTSWLQL